MKKFFLLVLVLMNASLIFSQVSQILPESFAYEHVYKIMNTKTKGFGSSIKVTSNDGKRVYLITARHLFKDSLIVNGSSVGLSIFHEEKWKPLKGFIKFHPNKNVDIVAIELMETSWTKNRFEVSATGVYLGQECIFFGFPFGFDTKNSGDLNRGFNIPWLKYAHVSSIFKDADGVTKVFLDGINNPGFSGGPVFTKIDNKLTLIAIISGYIPNNLDISYGGQFIRFPENTGIIISHSSNYINDLVN